MPLPILPILALGGLAALALSKKGDSGTVANPPAGQPPTPPALRAIFDDNMPYDLAKFIAMKISTSQDPAELWQLAQQSYGLGYVKAAAALVAACNSWRAKQGLVALAYPPLTPYPGGGGAVAVQPGPPAGPPGPQAPPGQPPVTPIPPGPPPPQAGPPPGGRPTPFPGTIPVTVTPGGGSPPVPPVPPSPPPKPVYGNYPAGTHTRPDGTAGYYTQDGDYSTAVIASKFGGTAADLMAANPGVAWTKNYAGTDLNIPASWLTQGPAQPGARGPNPPGGTSGGDVYTNPPSNTNTDVDSSAKVGKPLPKGAKWVNGQLMYRPQSGDTSAKIISDRFGHAKDSKALIAMNPGYPWTKGNKDMKVPNAWALGWDRFYKERTSHDQA